MEELELKSRKNDLRAKENLKISPCRSPMSGNRRTRGAPRLTNTRVKQEARKPGTGLRFPGCLRSIPTEMRPLE
jgi:hypothetical protein